MAREYFSFKRILFILLAIFIGSIESVISPPKFAISQNPPILPSNVSSERREHKICPGVHIRNDLKSFEQLKGCNIIDGPLTIALVSNQAHPYEPKDYENITFPQLFEVKEYLLFFRVQGLTNLSILFPNLAVIRGEELVSNYAFIIYEMTHLQKINLPKLTDILRGSVRIESNPNLCFVSTVNWEGICKHTFTPHFIKSNNQRCNNRCPDHCRPWETKQTASDSTKLIGDVKELGSENNNSIFCWSNNICHESCTDGLPLGPEGGCCSSQCSGGCYMENRTDQCIACRFVSQGNYCVEHCGSNLYEYKGRCIKKEECIMMVESTQQNFCIKTSDAQTSISNLKAIEPLIGEKHGRCQPTCSPGSEEDPMNKHNCKPCDKGKCRKICTPPQGSDKPFMVTNVNSLRELSGCNIINGSLEISMKGGRNVLHELEAAFQELEEIKGYLKITRSYPILTLGFLPNLKAINGSELDRGQYSLIIIDNPNLAELFTFNRSDSDRKQLTILVGKIFVHLNPKLCPHRIKDLKFYANVADWDDRDVSLHTNGDKEACTTVKLEVEYLHGTARVALIRFQNIASKMDDPRSLLYYLVNYREVPHGTVTMFDGKDGCNSQNDVWITVEESPVDDKSNSNKTDEYQEAVIKVKPATRYALYVKTYTIIAGSIGAISDIIYFETAPDTPGIPRQVESFARSHDSIIVSWLPPSKPNGIIERYLVTLTKLAESEDMMNLGVCDQIDSRDTITKSLSKNEPDYKNFVPSETLNGTSTNDTSNHNPAPSCPKSNFEVDPDIQAEVVTFQDLIIDIVYLKSTCIITGQTRTKKRSIEHELNSSAEPKNKPSTLKNDIPPTRDNTKSQDIKLNSINSIKIVLNRTIDDMGFKITESYAKGGGRLSYTIVGLEHYSMYSIEVVACHGNFMANNSNTLKNYNRCSLQAITHVRTHPIEEFDRIPSESIKFIPSNVSFSHPMVTWEKPERPNGLVLAYSVRYRLINGNPESWAAGCINASYFERNGGYILYNFSPGTYLLSVQTVSMYPGKRQWSEPELQFEISHNYLISPFQIFLLIFILVVVLSSAAASVTYYYQKKKHKLLYASVNPDYVQYVPDEWEVEKERLTIGSKIGGGYFGIIFKGCLATENGTINCAIKTVSQTSTTKQRYDFLREASIMKEFDTFHVVKLLGIVSVTPQVYVIMEFMEYGDLKKFLTEIRDKCKQENKTLVDGHYLMAAQIADGMAYLASKKFVHRDLAARNCMVGENQIVKVGDFGLTRDVYSNDYYIMDTQCELPVRWMAPESLNRKLYTSASDVWSYGIVLWEIVTFSSYPYEGLSNKEVFDRVGQGYTMPRPDDCPAKLFSIMEKCWRLKPTDRPSFNDIVEYLLPETEDKLYPNCFYRKQQKPEGDTMAQSTPEENTTGAESYPLLSWPSNRANGLTNGVNHVQPEAGEMRHQH